MAGDGGARMGALRRAGVWLGLVEDEGDRGYAERHCRSGADLLDGEDDVDEVPAPRARTTPARLSTSERLPPSERLAAADRLETSPASRTSTVRSITRPTTSVSYPTRDNLALA